MGKIQVNTSNIKIKIKELDKQFPGKGEVSNFEFKQVDSCFEGYIYELKGESGKHYEVFERKTTPVCVDFQKRIYSEVEFKVKYPRSKDFGVWAFTYRNIEDAKARFQKIKNKQHENDCN